MSKKQFGFSFISALALLLSFKLALAALPTTLNYQGHLTDNGGAPVNGDVNMTFTLYNVSAGGIALWSDTRLVTVNNGVFSIELGANPSVFPAGLFETPLWVGLSVAADAEMSPRRAVTSSGFAFKAEDANRLEGISAAALDQSVHVGETNNPHSVTAAQTGAADGAVLSAHTSNTANPHSVTAAQTGAADSASFILHSSNASAHHVRYNNDEAIAAMGATSDANPLNHTKRNNAQVMAAVTSLDGAGSTLDADLVDGLQASEIIDAAQDEVRTPISSLPFTINTSGSYYLTGNLDGSTGGIDITADKVTLDLMGFTLDGDGSVNDHGIDFSGRSNVVIKNGFISNFGLAGIYQSSSARYATVSNIHAVGNGTLGTGNAHSGIYLASINSQIEHCTTGDNGGYGIFAGVSSTLTNNTAYNNTGLSAIAGSSGSLLTGNIAYFNTGTSAIQASGSAILTDNIALSNTVTYAIFGAGGSTVADNMVYANIATYAIYGGTGTSLTGNTARSNTQWGIYGVGSNLIEGNTLYNNNTSSTADIGGLRVGSDSRVNGNTLDNNKLNNIVVSNSDNLIRENHFTDSTNGIFFNASGNYYKDNTAAGNTNSFNLNGTAQTNGGGNVSF